MEYKTCTTCNEVKALDQYYKRTGRREYTGPFDYKSSCIECTTAKQRNLYHENGVSEERKQQMKERGLAVTKLVRRHRREFDDILRHIRED